MSTALIVGGDQIDGIKQVLTSRGITRIDHWSGRKVGDSKKVIPHDTDLIVLVTNWISHTFTHKIKNTAAKRGVKIVYTPNGPAALQAQLEKLGDVPGLNDTAANAAIHDGISNLDRITALHANKNLHAHKTQGRHSHDRRAA